MKLWCVMREDLQEGWSTLELIFIDEKKAKELTQSMNDALESWETPCVGYFVEEWDTED